MTRVCTLVARRFQLKHNSFTDGIPIVIALKAMGITSDQEIVQLVGSDPRYTACAVVPVAPRLFAQRHIPV